DGRASISEMASAAAGRGYRYWAVTDHGRDLHLKSLSIQDVHRQAEEVRRLNAAFGGRITILHGVEANIGPEGGLDYPDEILAGYDVVVASVHHHLRGDRDAMTRRVLRAIEHPRVHIIGHPTGRRLPRRPPYELDLEAVCRAAAAHGVALEINSNPERLDLKDDHILLARDYGCLFAVDSDAHRPRELDLIRFGVFTAQRGWLVRERVINTWPLPRLRRFLSKRNSP
ncbi:MAG: PHP domain-containing protein, partial [Acidimicrobiales bacterium]